MKVSENCYAVTGLYFLPPWGVNAGFVVGKEKTLIIDSGANYISAQTIYGYALSQNEDNTLMVINTEKHLDHMGGNSFFREKEIDILGHYQIQRQHSDLEALIEEFNYGVNNRARRDENEASILFDRTTIVNPNIKISSDLEIDLGGIKAEIILTPGHTDTNLSVYVPSEGVLYSGDCIVERFIPNLEEGTLFEWDQWKKSVIKIENISPEIIVPGHGNIMTTQSAIKREMERLKIILDEAIKTGVAPTT